MLVKVIPISVFAISIILELIFDLSLCNLCQIQRWMWLLIFILLLLRQRYLVLFSLIGNFGFAVYQYMLQLDVLHESNSGLCKINYQAVEHVSCVVNQFTIFGFTLAFYNILVISIFTGIFVYYWLLCVSNTPMD